MRNKHSNQKRDKDKDVDYFISILKEYKDSVIESEAKSKDFLINIGVITKKGNLKSHYKNLCIPEEQV